VRDGWRKAPDVPGSEVDSLTADDYEGRVASRYRNMKSAPIDLFEVTVIAMFPQERVGRQAGKPRPHYGKAHTIEKPLHLWKPLKQSRWSWLAVADYHVVRVSRLVEQ
jgi:hypothetical protein